MSDHLIHTAAELDMLPAGSIVRSHSYSYPLVAVRLPTMHAAMWGIVGEEVSAATDELDDFPYQVVYLPDAAETVTGPILPARYHPIETESVHGVDIYVPGDVES